MYARLDPELANAHWSRTSAMTGGAQPDTQHFPPDGRLPGLGLALVAVLFVVISPLALVALGFNYDESGGSPLEKVHPATLLSFAVLGLSALYVRNPLTGLLNALVAYPGTLVFLIMIGLLIVHSIRVVSLPFTFFFDTFLAPVVVFFLFKDLCDQRARRFALLFHTLMMVNACIGIVEFAIADRITPLVANGLVIDGPVTQAEFLGDLGIIERTSRLMHANPARAGEIELGVARIIAPNGMGTRFKVIGVRTQGLPPLPGFAQAGG